jgi:hypothetical protein
MCQDRDQVVEATGSTAWRPVRLAKDYHTLPYVVHTSRELGLMLKGAKPLAMFSYIETHKIPVLDRYLRMFDRHVQGGRLLRREIREPVPQLPHLAHIEILYALPGEAWRMDALLELKKRPGPWSDDRERELGRLLGYKDWQNDAWLDRSSADGRSPAD